MRLVFMGSPEFSVPALHALREAGHEIVAVYTQPPRPAGRGKALRRQPVHEAAEEMGIEVRTPARLRNNPEAQAEFAALKADVAVVAAYGLILPPEILDAPRLGCLNIHASLLPRWRGASPIQSAILAGDSESGVCIMQMDEGLDTGAVLMRGTTPITADDTSATLHDRLAQMGAALIVRTLSQHPLPVAVPQPEAGMTYAPRLTREAGQIDWQASAEEIDCQIRAFTPWPGSFTRYGGQTLRIGNVLPLPAQDVGDAEPGTVLDDRLTVATGRGAVRITRLQQPGRAMMEAGDFLRGRPLGKGSRFD
ncbi:methionyl-tRNA formyltransferase [Oecophyllibacter saccharovorans]|uniref:methionyl-tRNA formyltransferase n=1 Tax=Oecophyllibacter saccharovorans TaxID=2558360 RepID=UPI001167A458|nr:methionyl-tRNA formyltransferase [Oecophyllibacter saccharovorans]TPW36868.1 methionyl-tRNA formyltransferase [Oecophyllibacter saccharovorans]